MHIKKINTNNLNRSITKPLFIFPRYPMTA